MKVKGLKFLIGLFSCFALLLSLMVVNQNKNFDSEGVIGTGDIALGSSNSCNNFTINTSYVTKNYGNYYTSNFGNLVESAYTSSGCGNEGLITFCLDPAYKSPVGNAYEVDRVLDASNPFDRAVLYLYSQVSDGKSVSVAGFDSVNSDFIVNAVTRLLSVNYNEYFTSGPLVGAGYNDAYVATTSCFNSGNCDDANIIKSNTPGAVEKIKELYLAAVNASNDGVEVSNGLSFGSISTQNNDTDSSINRVYTGIVNGSGSGSNFNVECTGGISCQITDSATGGGDTFSFTVTGSKSSIPEAGASIMISIKSDGASSYGNAMILSPVVGGNEYQRMIAFGAADLSKEIIIKPTNEDYCLDTNFSDNNTCTSSDINHLYFTEYEKYGVEDLKACLASDESSKKDGAGNEVVLLTNKYCNVTCGESWNFTLPGQVGSEDFPILSGAYFSLSTAVGAEKVCVSNKIDFTGFEADLVTYGNELAETYNSYLSSQAAKSAVGVEDSDQCLVSEGITTDKDKTNDKNVYETKTTMKYTWTYQPYKYDAATGTLVKNGGLATVSTGSVSGCTVNEASKPTTTIEAVNAKIKKITDAVSDIKACSNNDADYSLNFDPKLSYDYEEDYYMNNIIKSGNYYITSSGALDIPANATYSTLSTVTDDYSNVSSGLTTESMGIITSCGSAGCTTEKQDIPNSTYAKYTSKADDAIFKPYTVFWTVHPTGEVVGTGLNFGDSTQTGNVTTKLGRVFPVTLVTPEGNYTYKFAFNQIGEYKDGDLGRLMDYEGDEVSVNSSFTNKQPAVFDDSSLSASYACNYYVKPEVCKCCSGVELEVNGEVVDWTSNSEGYLTYYYKPVSLNQLFQDSYLDESGNVSSEIINWSNDKGQLVYEMIDDKKEDAYITPEYSYLLTPSVTSAIRANNNDSSFADFDMKCNEFGYNCSSTFLDDIASNPESYGADDDIELARPDNVIYYTNDIDLSTDLTNIRWVNYSGVANHDAENPQIPTGMGPAMK